MKDGISATRKFNFMCHLSEKISKANKGIGIMKRLYNFLPRATLVNIYLKLLSGLILIMAMQSTTILQRKHFLK